MTQRHLNRAVATVAGESLCKIRRRGFGPADSLESDTDPEPDQTPPQIVDWDAAMESCRVAMFPR